MGTFSSPTNNSSVFLFLSLFLFHVVNSIELHGLVPFHLRDKEGGCLNSANGIIGACDDEALLIYLPNHKDGHSLVSYLKSNDLNINKKTSSTNLNCLSRVSPKSKSSLVTSSLCKNIGSKNWQLVSDTNNQFFVTANNKETCLVRTIHSTEAHKASSSAIKKGQSYFNSKYLHNGLIMQPCQEGGTLFFPTPVLLLFSHCFVFSSFASFLVLSGLNLPIS